MYMYFVKGQNMLIMGDEIQYFGARKLWAKLSKKVDLVVDIINLDKDEYVERDVVVHQGKEDLDYDTRVCGKNYSNEIGFIRLILKDVKKA